MVTTPPAATQHVRNLERGKGGGAHNLDDVSKNLLSHHSAHVRIVSRGECTTTGRAVTCVHRGHARPTSVPRRNSASTVSGSSFSVNDLLARLAQPSSAMLGHSLCCLGPDDTLDARGVSCLVQRTAFLLHVCQVHETKLLADPCPEQLNGVQIRTLCRHIPQGNVLVSGSRQRLPGSQ